MNEREAKNIYLNLEDTLTSLENDLKILDYVISRSSLNDEMESTDTPKGQSLYKYFLIAKDQYMTLQILDNYMKQISEKAKALEQIREQLKGLAING